MLPALASHCATREPMFNSLNQAMQDAVSKGLLDYSSLHHISKGT